MSSTLPALNVLHTDIVFLQLPEAGYFYHKDVACLSAQQKELTWRVGQDGSHPCHTRNGTAVQPVETQIGVINV